MRAWQRDPQLARDAAAIVRPCPWCKRGLRPCNMPRHVGREHFRQMTVDEVLDLIEREGWR